MKDKQEDYDKKLVLAIGYAYYYFMDWRINKNETSRHLFFKYKFDIRRITFLKMPDINEIFYSVSAYNKPIQTLYNRLKNY